jgi:hypothetical protein
MNGLKHVCLVALLAWWCVFASSEASAAASQWQERNFPPPNPGHLVFIILADGNPACATYDGRNCLWGQSIGNIDFSRVKPLACGAQHRQLYGVTGFEDPKHWCNLALKSSTASPAPSTSKAPPPPPADTHRVTDWSGWQRDKSVHYRYRIWWTASSGGKGQTVDAEYEVRNPGSRPWKGSVRSASCDQNTLWGSTPVSLAPGETRSVRVKGPNCGTASNPDIRPGIGDAPTAID